MKYMLLVHHDEENFARFSETTRQEMLAESIQLTHQLHANGQYLHASPLQPISTAITVRVRDGKSFVTDPKRLSHIHDGSISMRRQSWLQ
jgi:hypothetical protein